MVKNYKLNQMSRQAGMTLIELTVVLLVLIGLAGLALPYVSGFVGKTHQSTAADSGIALSNAIQQYQAQTLGFPNNLNALNTAITTATTTLPNYLDNNWVSDTTAVSISSTAPTPAPTGQPKNYSLFALSANALKSLNAAGISSVATLPAGFTFTNSSDGSFQTTVPNGATFNTETKGATLTATSKLVTDNCAVATSSTVTKTCTVAGGADAAGSNASISGALNGYVPTGTLLVLGVGPASAMTNKTLTSVPVHFGDKASLQPNFTYGRFLAAFDVDTTAGSAAKFVGIVHAPDTGDQWEAIYSNITGFYNG